MQPNFNSGGLHMAAKVQFCWPRPWGLSTYTFCIDMASGNFNWHSKEIFQANYVPHANKAYFIKYRIYEIFSKEILSSNKL
jgi:hypothetical protein